MMKWSRGSGELPSDKTFLVIQHASRGSPVEGSGCSESWPKASQRRSRTGRAPGTSDGCSGSERDEEPRPATASLEAPQVLDPRLIDKLDMSLLSKESFADSLARISLGPAESSGDDNGNDKPLPVSARKPSLDSPPAAPEPESRTSVSPAARSASPRAKRLDDNNNKNREKERGNGSCLVQLSPVRSRSSRKIVNSSDVALFTGADSSTSGTRKCMLPVEPCRACGRAAQPERFHSHPKAPAEPAANDSRLARAKAPTRLEILQRQLPGTVLDRLAASSSFDLRLDPAPSICQDEKAFCEQEAAFARKERKVSSATNPNKPNEDKSVTSIGKRRPRTVTCYICGREFGSASFPIHEPKCLQKWHRENKALPNSQRRNVPQRPNLPIDHEDWNTAAWEQSQALLIPCPKCKRTFLPDRLAIHERNCRVPNKACVNNRHYNKAHVLSRSELERMDISNLLSRRNEADDQSTAGQMSARIKPRRIAVRMDGARKIA